MNDRRHPRTPTSRPGSVGVGGLASQLPVSEGGLGRREVGAVPPAVSPVGEGHGACGFVRTRDRVAAMPVTGGFAETVAVDTGMVFPVLMPCPPTRGRRSR